MTVSGLVTVQAILRSEARELNVPIWVPVDWKYSRAAEQLDTVDGVRLSVRCSHSKEKDPFSGEYATYEEGLTLSGMLFRYSRNAVVEAVLMGIRKLDRELEAKVFNHCMARGYSLAPSKAAGTVLNIWTPPPGAVITGTMYGLERRPAPASTGVPVEVAKAEKPKPEPKPKSRWEALSMELSVDRKKKKK